MVLAALWLLLWAVCGTALELDLSHSGLQAPPEKLCSRGVRAANLCANKLQSAPPCCSSFRRLHLYRNSIRDLPDGWLAECPLLEEVSVSGNSLRRLPSRLLGPSPSLRRLQASRNQLETLPAHLLQNATALRELDLSHNSLTEVPQGFLDSTSQLVELFLQANSLSDLPEELLSGCGSLRVLWLSGNQLKRLPRPLVAGKSQLRTLRLDHNLIEDIAAGAFDDNRKLTFLDLSSNRLTQLPAGLFSKATSLQRLLLADNQLTVVPPADSLPHQPAVIDLSYNFLRTVEDFVAFGESRVALDHNAWCHDLVPASQLSNFEGAESRRWFQQRPVRYDLLPCRVNLTAAGLLRCDVTTGGREGAADARADWNVTGCVATALVNRETLTQSPPTSETIVPLTNDLKTGEGRATSATFSTMPGKNTVVSEVVEDISVDGKETTAAKVSSGTAGTTKPETSASGNPELEMYNTANGQKNTSTTETAAETTYQS